METHLLHSTAAAKEKKVLEALLEISEKILTSLDLKTVLDRIMKLAIDVLEADSGSLMLLNELTKRLHIKASIGLSPEIAKKTTLKVGERIAGWVAQQQKPLLLLNGLKMYPDFAPFHQEKNIKSSLSVPLRVGNTLLGVLNINRLYKSSFPEFTHEDLELLITLGNQTAIAIHNARLHQQIQEQNRNLIRASRFKTELIANITHELRTPLTAIRGHTSNILDGALGALTKAQQERLEKIEQLCHRQSKLVNQLLEISRIASGHHLVKREPVALEKAINNVSSALNSLAEQKNTKIDIRFPSKLPAVWGVPDEIEKVFVNLLSNAIKYTAKGTITISVTRKNNYLLTTITDTGIGIPKENLSRIFDEFYRVDNEINTKEVGSGLGLTLVKHIIDAHKGKIWLKSQVSKGTSFYFTLPVDPRLLSKKREIRAR